MCIFFPELFIGLIIDHDDHSEMTTVDPSGATSQGCLNLNLGHTGGCKASDLDSTQASSLGNEPAACTLIRAF